MYLDKLGAFICGDECQAIKKVSEDFLSENRVYVMYRLFETDVLTLPNATGVNCIEGKLYKKRWAFIGSFL